MLAEFARESSIAQTQPSDARRPALSAGRTTVPSPPLVNSSAPGELDRDLQLGPASARTARSSSDASRTGRPRHGQDAYDEREGLSCAICHRPSSGRVGCSPAGGSGTSPAGSFDPLVVPSLEESDPGQQGGRTGTARNPAARSPSGSSAGSFPVSLGSTRSPSPARVRDRYSPESAMRTMVPSSFTWYPRPPRTRRRSRSLGRPVVPERGDPTSSSMSRVARREGFEPVGHERGSGRSTPASVAYRKAGRWPTHSHPGGSGRSLLTSSSTCAGSSNAAILSSSATARARGGNGIADSLTDPTRGPHESERNRALRPRRAEVPVPTARPRRATARPPTFPSMS